MAPVLVPVNHTGIPKGPRGSLLRHSLNSLVPLPPWMNEDFVAWQRARLFDDAENLIIYMSSIGQRRQDQLAAEYMLLTHHVGSFLEKHLLSLFTLTDARLLLTAAIAADRPLPARLLFVLFPPPPRQDREDEIAGVLLQLRLAPVHYPALQP